MKRSGRKKGHDSSVARTQTIRMGTWIQSVPYFDRPGRQGTIVFVHGLGNAAANFADLLDEPRLSDHRLIALDLPGCGDSPYPRDRRLAIGDLVVLLEGFVDRLGLSSFLLVGASMGGLVGLLFAERLPELLTGFMSVEGNLAAEDCMFSRLVTPHSYAVFAETVFPAIKQRIAAQEGRGFREHLRVLEKADPRAYYDYSFQLVEDSDHGDLVTRFLSLPMPRYFVYGSANRHLSYLGRLRSSDCIVREIPNADHFLFYDDPATFAVCIADAVT
jgi:pimeloyl-ACP methyl ester carboxylesterase